MGFPFCSGTAPKPCFDASTCTVEFFARVEVVKDWPWLSSDDVLHFLNCSIMLLVPQELIGLLQQSADGCIDFQSILSKLN